MIFFAPIFSDHAVLQRDKQLIVWGTLSRNISKDQHVTLALYQKDDETGKNPLFARTKTVDEVRGKKDDSWQITLASQPAGGPFTLIVSLGNPSDPFSEGSQIISDIMFGDVFLLAGQSNMEFCLKDDSEFKAGTIDNLEYPGIRTFRVPRIDYEGAEPEICAANNTWSVLSGDTAGDFSAVSFFFAVKLHKHTGVPVGLLDVSRGGTSASCWVDESSLKTDPDLEIYLNEYHELLAGLDLVQNKKDHDAYYANQALHLEEVSRLTGEGLSLPEIEKMIGWYPWPPPAGPYAYRSPCSLFHTMLEPLIPYGISAALFYQGEEDASRYYLYKKLLGSLIQLWRRLWDEADMPFFLVQIAPYSDPADTGMSAAYLKEIQVRTAVELPGVSLAVTTDCGDKDDIHPKSKRLIGERLFLKACRYLLYEDVAADSPCLISSVVRGGQMYMEFDTKDGGLLRIGPDGNEMRLLGFSLAGEDGVFYPADAEIRGKIVVADSPHVLSPFYVRYAFGGFVEANLFSDAGLPAEPFRTDRFTNTI